MTVTSVPSTPITGRSRFLDACRLQPTDATPVWFMRQAGRCLADYRAMREKYGILQIAKTPELAADVTVMAVDRFDVDAAVLFADIMLPLEGMGINLELLQGGPVIHNPVRSVEAVEALRIIEPEVDLAYVLEAIKVVRQRLGDGKAVIGFSGSPFTLACYMIEGGPSRDYGIAKSFMFSQPEAWHALMTKISTVVSLYLKAQIAAGVDAVQLFDSWVGGLNPNDYISYVQPHVRTIFESLSGLGVPSVHFGTGAASLLELMADAGGDVMSIDHRMNLDDAWRRIGYERGIQGNLDGTRVLAGWSPTEEGTVDVLRRAAGRPGHIFNLGHGVLPDTDPDILSRLVEFVRDQTSRRSYGGVS